MRSYMFESGHIIIPMAIERCRDTNRVEHNDLIGVERVGFGLWWRRLFNFLSKNDVGSCLNLRKTVVEGTQFQSKPGSRIPSFQSALSL